MTIKSGRWTIRVLWGKIIFLCTKLASDFQFHLHVAFVSIDDIDESRPQCLTFDCYFQ